MSGNWATGMRVSATAPTIVMTIAMTAASRGRSTKIAEIIGSPPAPWRTVRRRLGIAYGTTARPGAVGGGAARAAPRRFGRDWRGRARRARRDGLAWADSLQPFADDQLSLLEPAGHDGGGRGRLAELDAPLLHLPLHIDNIDVVALLIGQNRGSRNRQNENRLHAFENHGHELTVRQLARSGHPCLHARKHRIGEHAAHSDRVGVFGDCRRHVVERVVLLVDL